MSLDVLAIDAAIGIFVGPLVGLITGENTPGWLKSILAILLSLALGLIHVYFTNGGTIDFTGSKAAASFAAVLIASGVSYQTVTRPLSQKLQTNVPIKIGNSLGS